MFVEKSLQIDSAIGARPELNKYVKISLSKVFRKYLKDQTLFRQTA